MSTLEKIILSVLQLIVLVAMTWLIGSIPDWNLDPMHWQPKFRNIASAIITVGFIVIISTKNEDEPDTESEKKH